MNEVVPDDIKTDLENACILHDRAVSDYAQCMEFSKLMSDILARLEDACCYQTADKVMSVLLNCNPKIGAHCDKSIVVAQATKKLR
ncbi:hypothetical protein [Desulfobacula sp.]|uniref:hypothetical protein n=1 Tax=Desulfobacula sp. TaxID=2593537 RepID=UPI002623F320|nr:hypothetical protein [Desulfobacula sp.]